jgi:hypothetical protein
MFRKMQSMRVGKVVSSLEYLVIFSAINWNNINKIFSVNWEGLVVKVLSF